MTGYALFLASPAETLHRDIFDPFPRALNENLAMGTQIIVPMTVQCRSRCRTRRRKLIIFFFGFPLNMICCKSVDPRQGTKTGLLLHTAPGARGPWLEI